MESVTSFFWNEASNTAIINDVLGMDEKYTKDPNKPHPERSLQPNLLVDVDSSTGIISNANLQKVMTDALVEKLMKMALPPTTEMGSTILEQRLEISKERPRLSVPIMSRNFIQTNARLSVPFTMVDEIMNILNWTNPAYTLSIMIFYSLLILKPLPAVFSLPILYILFGIMVPQYLYIHKPESSPYFDFNPTPAQGTPLRKPAKPVPASELSQEFVLNLADLQNHMLLFVQVYDFFAKILNSFAFFTNEMLSAAMFMTLLAIALINALFIDTFIKYIPYKQALLILGWTIILLLHPKYRENILATINSEEIRLRVLTLTNRYEELLNEELKFVEASERKLVAVYEIQKVKEETEWVHVGYSNSNFTLFSDLRINELAIDNYCEIELENIKPPIDWEWVENSRWVLDLDPSEWVESDFVQFVKIDSETKWVYDLNIDGSNGMYRRRMWTNICTRKKELLGENIEVEVVNPLREKKYSQDIHGVSKNSFTGLSKSVQNRSLSHSKRRVSSEDDDIESNLVESSSSNRTIPTSRGDFKALDSLSGILGG